MYLQQGFKIVVPLCILKGLKIVTLENDNTYLIFKVMCLRPISIPTRSRFISLNHRDSYLMRIPCGQCAECQSVKRNEWYYRSYYEFLRLKEFGGNYVYFDTLTYDDEHLPHLSDFWTFLDRRDDMPCFDYYHIRLFLQNLRIRLIRLGYKKDAFRYFVASEYGSDGIYYDSRGRQRVGTHRPHYHIMLYIYDDIPLLLLSNLVSKIWNRGRTDGMPYRDFNYVSSHNFVSADSPDLQRLRVVKYVSKYVQKSCLFVSEIDKRLSRVMLSIARYVCDGSSDFVSVDDYLSSEEAHKERLKLKRYVSEFHRQSQGYGLFALNDVDMLQLYQDGFLHMPDSDSVNLAIPLPTYYKRKLFYEMITVDGSRYWQLNSDGIDYKKARQKSVFDSMVSRYDCVREYYNLDFDASVLADYLLNVRGRIKNAECPESVLSDRLFSDCLIYNYVTGSDRLQFRKIGLSFVWLGDSQSGYKYSYIPRCISVRDFIANYVEFNDVLEIKLRLLDTYLFKYSDVKQLSYELRQRLENVRKLLI